MKGRIYIGRFDNENESKIEIILVDGETTSEICKITMSIEAFGLAVTGLGDIPVDIELLQDILI